MRTCQPHLSISWNFPPPPSPLIYSISFTQTLSQLHNGVFTRSLLQIPLARDSVGGTLLQPNQKCFICSWFVKKGEIFLWNFLVSPKISLHCWQPIWLWCRGRLQTCSEKMNSRMYFFMDQRFCRQLSLGQVSLTQDNTERREHETPFSKVDPSSCQVF